MAGSATECSTRNVLQLKELEMKGMMPRPGQQAGHVIHNACYQGKNFFYKQNKQGKAEHTIDEWNLSKVANLSLKAHLTPKHYLVKEGETIVGLAVEDMKHTIPRREGPDASYYELEKTSTFEILPNLEFKKVSSSSIPVYFFDGLPADCFATLLAKEKAGLLSIDRSSLASVFVTAYTYEEDDLHRGNWGVYFCNDNEIPKAVFFKIDHDLLFVASIKVFVQKRLFHLFESDAAFHINVSSLECLPNVSSHNDYWPTKKSYLPNLFDKKGYHSSNAVRAFSSLETDSAFEKEKWLAFYKQILLPNKLIYENLMGVGEDIQDSTKGLDPVMRARANLVYQATVTRLSHLRAALLASEKFCHFVLNLTDAEKTSLAREIVVEGPHLEEVLAWMTKIESLCSPVKKEETPLHLAIKLKTYRFEESLAMFGQSIHVKNHEGKTPLELAIDLYHQEHDEEALANLGGAIQHLLAQGAKTKQLLPEIKPFINPYVEYLDANTSYKDLKKQLILLSEDHRYSLKFRKTLTINCVHVWLEVRKNNMNTFKEELEQFKCEMNGHCPAKAAAGLKFIRQLRSQLWIIRHIRGLYGRTTTQVILNQMIDQALKPLSPSTFIFSWSIFAEKSGRVVLDRDRPAFSPSI